MVEMEKCEICGKLHPKGTICCGASTKNETYMEDRTDDPDVTR